MSSPVKVTLIKISPHHCVETIFDRVTKDVHLTKSCYQFSFLLIQLSQSLTWDRLSSFDFKNISLLHSHPPHNWLSISSHSSLLIPLFFPTSKCWTAQDQSLVLHAFSFSLSNLPLNIISMVMSPRIRPMALTSL